jgi:hypothetical protein
VQGLSRDGAVRQCFITSCIIKGYNRCAVGVHNRQDNRIGKASVQAKAVGKAKTTTKKKTRKEQRNP